MLPDGAAGKIKVNEKEEHLRISIATIESNTVANHGYGVAHNGMVAALTALGHEVKDSDPGAPVEIAFVQPKLWNWTNPNSYHIGYVPWESTRLPEGWLENMKLADEIWTTSAWCKRMFEKSGLENIKVFHHGVDQSVWQRKRRNPENRPLRFLHIGEPAPRKAGQMVYDTFMDVFGDSAEYATLTIKAHGHNTVRGTELVTIGEDGNLYMTPENRRKSVRVVTQDMPEYELVDLVRRHDVLVYPSYGEGFGLIPLQALVTGMPTICTAIWAPYRQHLLPALRLPAKLIPSPWPDIHPGNMYEPDAQKLGEIMADVAENYNTYSLQAYAQSFAVEQDFDWLLLTAAAFKGILEKFETKSV